MQVAINVIFFKSQFWLISINTNKENYILPKFFGYLWYMLHMIFEFGICSIIETSSCLYLSSNAFIHVYLVCLITTTHDQITSFSISFIIKILIKCLLKTDKLYIVNMHLLIKSVYYFN